MAVFEAFMLFCLAKLLYCTEYYVWPDPSTAACPTADPCFTLSEYFQNSAIYFTSGSTFTLLQGEHHLNDILVLSDVTGITFRGEDLETTSILINTSGSIICNNSQDIEMKSLWIRYRGGTRMSHTALSFEDCSFQVLNVQFTGVNGEAVYSQGIRLMHSKASFINCSFTSWHSIHGGAVYSDTSNVTFLGYITFRNNSAYLSGGGFYACNNSIVNFTGTNIFEDNTASTLFDNFGGGAGLFGLNSTIEFYGINNFTRNGPVNANTLLSGGGIKVHSSVLMIHGRAFFIENFGTYAGALFGGDSNIMLTGKITFSHNRFGGSVSLYGSNLTCSGEIFFTNNEIMSPDGFGSAVYCQSCRLILNGDILFANNTAHTGLGGAVYTFDSYIYCWGNVTFVNNSAEGGIGGAILIDQSTFEGFGSINFTANYAAFRGGGVYAIDSKFYITGSSVFNENAAVEGGGIGLEGSARLVLHFPIIMIFERNRASSIGGAIVFIDSSTAAQCQNLSVQHFSCFFGIENENSPTSGIHLYFTQNYAKQSGTVLYGGSLQLCRVPVNGINIPVNSLEFFQNISQITQTNNDGRSVSTISSDPLRVCICNNSILDCSQRNIRTIKVTRGAQFFLSVVTVGQGNTPVPSTIRAYIKNNDNMTQLEPQSHVIEGTCTNIVFRLYTGDENKTLILYPEGRCGDTEKARQENQVVLGQCPPGFSPNGIRCTCEERLLMLKEDIVCDIDTYLIERPGNYWINPIWDMNMSYSGFVYHPDCPPGYCKPQSEKLSFQFLPNVSDVQCSSNRSGTLCGACRESYSLTLSNFNCKKCDNHYISLLLFFAIAGVAVIAILLVLHMTVAAGTINGLILYANIVNANSIIFIPPNTTNILTVFIAWLNLDFGIPTCFFDGLNFYSFAWLKYVFPFYLWFLIGAIIIVCKLSAKFGKLFGSNPVAVLATVILMSFTTLLQATIVDLSPTFLEYPDGSRKQVWLYDANITYFRGKHFFLALMALCVILFLLLPYTLLLLFSYRLQAYSDKRAFSWLNKIKPFLDAYYAPYRAKTILARLYAPGSRQPLCNLLSY